MTDEFEVQSMSTSIFPPPAAFSTRHVGIAGLASCRTSTVAKFRNQAW